MSVGDMKNNLCKLRAELTAVKYEKDIDYNSISKGLVAAFLPIYHYLFLEYSHHIAEEVSNKNIELSGKTDLRFVEAMYKLLREIYSYKPPVTKEQLFANGFAERKVIMCGEIVSFVKKRQKILNPKTSTIKPGSRTGQTVKLGPRSANITQGARSKAASTEAMNTKVVKPEAMKPKLQLAATSGSKINQSKRVSSHPSTLVNKPAPDALPVKAINELRQSVTSSISPVVQPVHDAPCLLHRDENPSTEPSYIPADSPLAAALEDGPITIQTKVVREDGPRRAPHVAWGDMKAVVVDDQLNDSSSYNPALYGAVQVQDSEGTSHDSEPVLPPRMRPIDIIPKTPARPMTVQSNQSEQNLDVLCHMKTRMEELTTHVTLLTQRLTVVEGQLAMMHERDEERKKAATEGISPEQLETLLARITLGENKVALLEAQQKSLKATVKNQTNQVDDMTPKTERITKNVTQKAVDLPFSPIRPLAGSERNNIINNFAVHENSNTASDYHERWSSTPTELDQPIKDPVQPVNDPPRSEPPVKNDCPSQVNRITAMLRDTESLLNMQDTSPVRPMVN